MIAAQRLLACLPMLLAIAQPGRACDPGAEPDGHTGKVLTTSITGYIASSGLEDPQYVLSFPAVQRLVLCAVQAPVDEAAARKALQGVPPSLDDLVALGLLRAEGGKYRLSYPVFTVEDQARVTRVGREAAKSLAEAFEEKHEQIAELLSKYPRADLRPQVAFAVVAGMLLNWEGLEIGTRLGYRARPPKRPNGDSYLVRSHETGYQASYEGLYWGSHTFPGPRMYLSTFGDSDSIPRINGLPDVLSEPVESGLEVLSAKPELYSAARDEFILELKSSLGDAGNVMAALADGPATITELQESGMPRGRLDAALSLLKATGYVQRAGD